MVILVALRHAMFRTTVTSTPTVFLILLLDSIRVYVAMATWEMAMNVYKTVISLFSH